MRRLMLMAIPFCWAAAGVTAREPVRLEAQRDARYRVETRPDRAESPEERFDASQLALLEKLNRADAGHLAQLPSLIVPGSWADGLSGVLPARYPASEAWPTFLVVYLPGQVFGAYERGRLVRWGPLSSGAENSPTGAGLFSLNWRSEGRASTVDPDWFMRWYFNFGNRDGLAFHAYSLPGYPASHGCIRLLERDARWLYEWGEAWTLAPDGTRVLAPGTPVFIVGRYDFDAPPPWRSLEWLATTVDLPPPPVEGSERP